jgi:hypothetical protein
MSARMERAAKAADICGQMATKDPDHWRHLAEIGAAAKRLWAALVEAIDLGQYRSEAQDFVLNSAPCRQGRWRWLSERGE